MVKRTYFVLFLLFYIYWYLFNGLPGIWSILKNVSCTLEKNTIVAKNWFYNIQVPFIMLISCLVVLFLKVGVEVYSSFCWVVYFSLHFCQFFFMYFDVLLLGTYVFIIVIAIWWIELSNVIQYPSISSNFFKKSVLFVITIVNPAFSYLLFVWCIFFHEIYFYLLN